jgi:C1A family cysteine protease
LLESGFQFVEENGGICSEASYPYVGRREECAVGTRNSTAKIRSFARVMLGSERAMQKVVARIGPVAASVDARQRSFQLYKSGVYSDPMCAWFLTSHALLIVGYGHDHVSGQDFWLAKNSWGEKWGEQGYVRIARNQANHCGIATNSMFPI